MKHNCLHKEDRKEWLRKVKSEADAWGAGITSSRREREAKNRELYELLYCGFAVICGTLAVDILVIVIGKKVGLC